MKTPESVTVKVAVLLVEGRLKLMSIQRSVTIDIEAIMT
jgi:hypothetical protein